MMIVKTQSESTEETCNYLKHNGYGTVIIRVFKTDHYLCFFRGELVCMSDVEIVKQY